MSDKEIGGDALQRIPESASPRDRARQIEFVDAARRRLAELDRGERIPIEAAGRQLPSGISQ
jgi:hypothetical protein